MCSLKTWDYGLNLNLTQVFLFTKYLQKCLINCDENASVINIGSISGGREVNITQTLPYNVAKAGLNRLTETCALGIYIYMSVCQYVKNNKIIVQILYYFDTLYKYI